MSSIFDEKTLEKIKKIRTTSLRVFVAILIIEVVAWALIIIARQSNEIIMRFQLTFLVIAGALFVSILNFRSIEKGNMSAQILSLISLCACALWTVLEMLVVWGLVSLVDSSGLFSYKMNGMGIFVSIISSTMTCMMLAGCVARIEENGGPIKPLKITALSSIMCAWFITVIMTASGSDLSSDFLATAGPLLGLAILAFLVTAIAASVMSRTNRRDKLDKAVASDTIKNNEEAQAAIKEMVEKEVQSRLAEERAKTEQDVTPPSQPEELASEVPHDNSSSDKVEEETNEPNEPNEPNVDVGQENQGE